MRLVRYNTYPGYRFNDFNNCDFNHFAPEYKILSEEDAYKVVLSVPGFNKDDFQVKLEKNTLIISSEIEENKEEKSWKESFRKSFEQRFKLSDKVEADKISAAYSNGLLEIQIPKKEPEAIVSKQIEIA